MNVRLVLCSAPVPLQERYGLLAELGSTEPSFGLACLAGAAQQAGADTSIVEASSENLSVEQAAVEILRHDPHVVGISATTSGIVAAGALADILNARNSKLVVIVGGCHASALPEQTLREFTGFDLVVIGEGERTLEAILGALAIRPDVPRGIEGTAERSENGVKRNPPRALIENLDDLPLPAWPLLRGFPRAYHPSPARIRRWPCASVVLTRGCPNRCTFCDRSVFGNRCRSYSPGYAVRLIKDLRDNHGVREILIEDDTFIIIKDRIREFCGLLISEDVKVSWSCLGRADRVDPALLKLMKKAGCWHISYGIESGDPEILRSVNKNLDLKQIREAVEWSRQAGLRTKGFFMVGFPGETRESLRATHEFAMTLPLDDISIMQLSPFPGSELYGAAGQYGELTPDWRQMNALNTVFVPKGLTRNDLDDARSRLLRAFFFRPAILWRTFLLLVTQPRAYALIFRALISVLRFTSRRRTGGKDT